MNRPRRRYRRYRRKSRSQKEIVEKELSTVEGQLRLMSHYFLYGKVNFSQGMDQKLTQLRRAWGYHKFPRPTPLEKWTMALTCALYYQSDDLDQVTQAYLKLDLTQIRTPVLLMLLLYWSFASREIQVRFLTCLWTQKRLQPLLPEILSWVWIRGHEDLSTFLHLRGFRMHRPELMWRRIVDQEQLEEAQEYGYQLTSEIFWKSYPHTMILFFPQLCQPFLEARAQDPTPANKSEYPLLVRLPLDTWIEMVDGGLEYDPAWAWCQALRYQEYPLLLWLARTHSSLLTKDRFRDWIESFTLSSWERRRQQAAREAKKRKIKKVPGPGHVLRHIKRIRPRHSGRIISYSQRYPSSGTRRRHESWGQHMCQLWSLFCPSGQTPFLTTYCLRLIRYPTLWKHLIRTQTPMEFSSGVWMSIWEYVICESDDLEMLREMLAARWVHPWQLGDSKLMETALLSGSRKVIDYLTQQLRFTMTNPEINQIWVRILHSYYYRSSRFRGEYTHQMKLELDRWTESQSFVPNDRCWKLVITQPNILSRWLTRYSPPPDLWIKAIWRCPRFSLARKMVPKKMDSKQELRLTHYPFWNYSSQSDDWWMNRLQMIQKHFQITFPTDEAYLKDFFGGNESLAIRFCQEQKIPLSHQLVKFLLMFYQAYCFTDPQIAYLVLKTEFRPEEYDWMRFSYWNLRLYRRLKKKYPELPQKLTGTVYWRTYKIPLSLMKEWYQDGVPLEKKDWMELMIRNGADWWKKSQLFMEPPVLTLSEFHYLLLRKDGDDGIRQFFPLIEKFNLQITPYTLQLLVYNLHPCYHREMIPYLELVTQITPETLNILTWPALDKAGELIVAPYDPPEEELPPPYQEGGEDYLVAIAEDQDEYFEELLDEMNQNLGQPAEPRGVRRMEEFSDEEADLPEAEVNPVIKKEGQSPIQEELPQFEFNYEDLMQEVLGEVETQL